MNAPTAAQITTPGEREIHIERVFNASRERVWAAHTEPDLLKQWWGRGNPLDVERWELNKGGHYRLVEHADGGVEGFEGRFREITPVERLVYTFEWDGMPGYVCVNDLRFEDLGERRTRLVTDVIFHTGPERDGMAATGMADGLNQSYAALDRLLAA